MLKNSPARRIDMIFLNTNGSIRVNDSLYFWSEDPLDWFYNFCYSFEENESSLLRLVYGETNVNYSVSTKLANYLDDRKSVYEKIKSYQPIIEAILNSDIPLGAKSDLLNTINQEIHQRFPYKEEITN